MDEAEQHIETLFLTISPELVMLTQQLRNFLKAETKPSIELVFTSYNSINIGYGFTEKAWDCYCGIIVYSKHINISFPSGAHLVDPNKLLKGTGSKVRHVRIDEFDNIKNPAVVKLLQQARDKAWNLTKEKNSDEKAATQTIVKTNSNNKK